MRAYLGRRYHLSASHRLHADMLSTEENRSIYGKCNHPYGHGHNYVVEVIVGGSIDPQTGTVCDLAQLDKCVQTEILDRFDHTNLNCDAAFRDQVPTTENFNIELYTLLKQAFHQAELVSIRVEETAKNSFEYPVPAKTGRASAG
jgi:6-pyruvoyltetrahydropterin/6-carboxytetrahydropterin synthase